MEKLKKALIWCAIGAVVGCLVYVHRRVILAAIKGEELPEAPAWHFWCRKK